MNMCMNFHHRRQTDREVGSFSNESTNITKGTKIYPSKNRTFLNIDKRVRVPPDPHSLSLKKSRGFLQSTPFEYHPSEQKTKKGQERTVAAFQFCSRGEERNHALRTKMVKLDVLFPQLTLFIPRLLFICTETI